MAIFTVKFVVNHQGINMNKLVALTLLGFPKHDQPVPPGPLCKDK